MSSLHSFEHQEFSRQMSHHDEGVFEEETENCCFKLQNPNKVPLGFITGSVSLDYKDDMSKITPATKTEIQERFDEEISKLHSIALGIPGSADKTNFETKLTDNSCPVEELTTSRQMVLDIEYMKSVYTTPTQHLGNDEVWVNAAIAFELVLGNAIMTWPPIKKIIDLFITRFVGVMKLQEPSKHISEYLKNYPGFCFAGFTEDLKSDTDLADWLQTENSRSALTKSYWWAGDFVASPSVGWMHHSKMKDCTTTITDSDSVQHTIEDHLVDPWGLFPRWKMPRRDAGFGWFEVQFHMLPNRHKMGSPDSPDWIVDAVNRLKPYVAKGEVLPITKSQLDPTTSASEQAANLQCPKIGAVGQTDMQWVFGKYIYSVDDNSPLDIFSKIVGLPVIAGTSGSTHMCLLPAAEYFGLSRNELILFRLALIGWMCEVQDHSMLEIIQGAARIYPGKSYPKWEAAGEETPHTLRDWRHIHQNLLPHDFSMYDNHATLTSFNAHVEHYMASLSSELAVTIAWPSTASSDNPWWEHQYFAFHRNLMLKQKAAIVSEIEAEQAKKERA